MFLRVLYKLPADKVLSLARTRDKQDQNKSQDNFLKLMEINTFHFNFKIDILFG